MIRSEAADEDMLAIADDLAASISIDAALVLDEQLDAAIESLDEMSHRGRVVLELRGRGITTYRELLVAPYYRIMYRVEDREVWVIAVLDHRRDLDTVPARRNHGSIYSRFETSRYTRARSRTTPLLSVQRPACAIVRDVQLPSAARW